jgi:hypothetical protein
VANMSYCRFQNTLSDLRDCEEALGDIASFAELSADEARAARKLIETCGSIVADFGYMAKAATKREHG